MADVLATQVFQYSPTQQSLLEAYARPDPVRPAFWLGSDEFGRRTIVRLLYGARLSLGVGIGAALSPELRHWVS